MAQPQTERTAKSAAPTLILPELAAIGKKRIEECVNAQTDLFDKLGETSLEWFDRVQSEADLASEFASKLTAARSSPEAMTACQEWSNRHITMMADDGKHLLADAQKLTETGARFFFNGWLSGRDGGIT